MSLSGEAALAAREVDERWRDANTSVLQDDLRDLLRLLGLPDGAQFPHEVFRECINAVATLRAEVDELRVALDQACRELREDGEIRRLSAPVVATADSIGFTPGPWRYRPAPMDDWGVVRGPAAFEDGGGWYVARAYSGRFETDYELNEHRRNKTDPYEANARLIAAAPDLLAALGPLAMAARRQSDVLRHEATQSTSGVARVQIEAAQRWEAMHDAARAAIAKATGSAA